MLFKNGQRPCLLAKNNKTQKDVGNESEYFLLKAKNRNEKNW